MPNIGLDFVILFVNSETGTVEEVSKQKINKMLM